MITYQSSSFTWTSSQALAHFGLEMIFFSSINRLLKGPSFFKRLRALIKQDFNPSETWSLGRNRFRRCTSALKCVFIVRNVWYVWHALLANGMADDANTVSKIFSITSLGRFQCYIRHLLSSQISRCVQLKQTKPPSAYHHHWLYHCRLHFAIQTQSRLFGFHE